MGEGDVLMWILLSVITINVHLVLTNLRNDVLIVKVLLPPLCVALEETTQMMTVTQEPDCFLTHPGLSPGSQSPGTSRPPPKVSGLRQPWAESEVFILVADYMVGVPLLQHLSQCLFMRLNLYSTLK